MPRRRSRSCPSVTASSFRSRSFSSLSLWLAPRSAHTTASWDLVVMRSLSGRAGRPEAGCPLARFRSLVSSAVWRRRREKFGKRQPGSDPGDGDRAAVALQAVQDCLDAFDAVQTALLSGFGQVCRVVSPHRLPSRSRGGRLRFRPVEGTAHRVPRR